MQSMIWKVYNFQVIMLAPALMVKVPLCQMLSPPKKVTKGGLHTSWTMKIYLWPLRYLNPNTPKIFVGISLNYSDWGEKKKKAMVVTLPPKIMKDIKIWNFMNFLNQHNCSTQNSPRMTGLQHAETLLQVMKLLENIEQRWLTGWLKSLPASNAAKRLIS